MFAQVGLIDYLCTTFNQKVISMKTKTFTISADTRVYLDLLAELQDHYNKVCRTIEGESQELEEAYFRLREIEGKLLHDSVMNHLEEGFGNDSIEI